MNKQDLVTAHEVLSQFPELLRAHRFRLNLSLSDVADVVGTSPRNVSAWELRKWNPSVQPMLVTIDWMARSWDDLPRPGESREQLTERAAAARKARFGDQVQAS